jgi:(S)-ureidoglycine-glyoxylate aminotransferase
MPIEVDKWCLDAVTAGLQKCLSGPPGCSPLTINDRVAEIVNARKHVEAGIRSEDFSDADGLIVQSNYFDLAMLMDYWSSKRLNHHTEATTMLYAAHTCAQEVLREGLEAGFARHRIASQALRAGLTAMNLKLFGNERYRMDNVTGVFIPNALGDGEQVRTQLLDDFGLEIGTSFGPLRGKIWRIGTMGYVCHKVNILRCLSALEIVMRRNGFVAPPGAGVDAAYKVYMK